MVPDSGEDHPGGTGNFAAIKIPAALQKELRDFCDRNSLRYVDFVEDSLERAMYIEEIEALLSKYANVRLKIESEQKRAFMDGFCRGVLSATLALQGELLLSEGFTPSAAKDLVAPREVTGNQMKLFDTE